MRRGQTTAVPKSAPVITLQSPNDHQPFRSGSTSSSQDNMTTADNASAFGTQSVGPTGGGWDPSADYKDTVLFLAQQQSLQHREMMDMLKTVLHAVAPLVSSGTGMTPSIHNNRREDALSELAAVDEPQQQFVSSHDHQLQSLMQYGHAQVGDASSVKDLKLRQMGGYTGTQSGWFQSVSGIEVELHAAKARIAQMESVNRLLQEQLTQKEETIRRLTQSNVSSLTQRMGGDSLSAKKSPSSSIILHATTPNRSTKTTDFASPVMEALSAKRLGTAASPAVQLLLKKHQEECQHILSHATH